MAKRTQPKGRKKKVKRVVVRRRRRRVGLPANRVIENNQFRQLDARLAGLEGRQFEQFRTNYNSRQNDFEKAQMVQCMLV